MSGRDTSPAEAARLLSYLVFAVAAAALFLNARGLPTSRWEPLGAGSFPQLIFGTLVVLCLVGAAQSARALAGTGGFGRLVTAVPGYLRSRRLVIALFVGFALYITLMRPLGFGASTFVFLLGACLMLAPRTLLAWGVSLVIALAFSYGLEALFADVFNVFLPRARWSPF